MLKMYPIFIIILTIGLSIGFAQHRGDNLSFQGFPAELDPGVKALAMGGAYTSITGDLNALFYNPAGLAALDGFQVSLAANSHNKLWREGQDYRPNRIYWTMPFYLEGLYTPDPANNGVWDYEFAKDSSYIVQRPQTGAEPFSEEAADWTQESKEYGFNYLAAALPLTISDQRLVISAAFRINQIFDYDRNDTYLDPHIGFDAYGVMPRVVTDTLSFMWSAFERNRSGYANTYIGSVAWDLSDVLNLGAGLSILEGETDDYQRLTNVGRFDIARDNRFRFTYDTLITTLTGQSLFSAYKFNIGAVLTLDHVNLGFNIYLPYTLERTWNYDQNQIEPGLENNNTISGKDKLKLPATYVFGGSLTPVRAFTIAFDYEFSNLSQAELSQTMADSTTRGWSDRHIIRLGIEYRAFEFLSFLAGYRDIPSVFIPDGAAIKDSGPAATSYTFGFSLNVFGNGMLDFVYEHSELKYYDSYFSNTNYVFEKLSNLAIAYTYKF